MDNEVKVTFVFHAMGDDPQTVLAECMDYFDRDKRSVTDPQEVYVSVKPR